MPTASRLVATAAALAVTLAAACASSPKGGTPGDASVVAAPRSNPNVLTAEDIERQGSSQGSIYDAIRRLRPSFLTYRGVAGSSPEAGRVHVSLDDGPVTAMDALKSIPASTVAYVRYFNAADAAQRFGTSAESGPVVVVHQK